MIGQTGEESKGPERIDCTGFVLLLVAMSSLVTLTTCQDGTPPLTAEVPLHLEDHLDAAVIAGSDLPNDFPKPVEWHFDEPQPDWQPVVPLLPSVQPARITQTEDSLRITLNETNDYRRRNRTFLNSAISVDVPNWRREEWGDILVRARSASKLTGMSIWFNLRDEIASHPWGNLPFQSSSLLVPVISDGTEQTYVIRADEYVDAYEQWEGSWRQLGVAVFASEPGSIDVLSVSVVPKSARFADARLGVKSVSRDQAYRRTLYTHAPSRVEYRMRVPKAGRLDVGLGVLDQDIPVSFRVTAQPDGQVPEQLLDEPYSDKEHWGQRSADLSHLAGKDITLALEADAERPGTIALWAAPTVSGVRANNKPNVIFYIIDSAASDYMSAYGYNRRTTPNIELLASEGALFENAYSNSSWTRPSTLSFLTGLQHSAMGGMRNNRNTPPEEILTVQEHLHASGYQTALFTTNANAGTMSNLDRGIDVLREKGAQPNSGSSKELQSDFWKWRSAYPAEPYWGTLPNDRCPRSTQPACAVCRALCHPGASPDL